MSINGNYIRGYIAKEEKFFILVKRKIGDNEFYGTMSSVLKNGKYVDGVFGGTLDYKDYAKDNLETLSLNLYSYRTVGKLFTFKREKTLDKGDSESTLSAKVEDGATEIYLHPSEQSLGLKVAPYKPVNTNKLFAGVWYDLHDIHDNVLKWKWFETDYIGSDSLNGFNPHIVTTDNPSLYHSQVQFVPYTTSCLKVEDKRTSSVNRLEAMKYITYWIKKDTNYYNTNCTNGGKASHCIYTIHTVKGMAMQELSTLEGNGWNYCIKDQFCGKCYGKCKDPKRICTYDSSSKTDKFTCKTQAEIDEENETGWTSYAKYIGFGVAGLITLLIVIGLVFWFSRKKNSPVQTLTVGRVDETIPSEPMYTDGNRGIQRGQSGSPLMQTGNAWTSGTTLPPPPLSNYTPYDNTPVQYFDGVSSAALRGDNTAPSHHNHPPRNPLQQHRSRNYRQGQSQSQPQPINAWGEQVLI